MMSTKINTKAFAEKNTVSPVSDNTKERNISATQEADFLGGKDIGQVLNEMSDPNYVDPAKMRKPENKMDKDAFLKLMLTQLKYQDPMNPMESKDMAAQLAQFSSLEQLSNINESVKGLQKGQDPIANYQALNFIGKSISANTEKVIRSKGDKTHDLRFELAEAAKEVTVKIKDEANEVVKTLKLSGMKRGENKITWNGTKEDGYPAFSGNYSFSVEGVSDRGVKLSGKTSFSGTVTGLNYSPEGPILMIGDQKVRLSDVKKIEDVGERAALESREQPSAQQQLVTPPLSMVPKQNSANVEAAGAEDRPVGNIDAVPMSGDLKYRLAKETNLKE